MAHIRAKYVRNILIGLQLLRKPDKNEFEKKAARSFILVACSTLFLLGILAIVMIVSLLTTFEPSTPAHSAKRTGTVEGNKVRYVQNTVKYATLEELDIDPDSVEDGDRIELYFNVNDRLIGAESSKDEEGRMVRLLTIYIVSIVVVIVLLLLISKAFGKPMNEYYQYYNYQAQMRNLRNY